MTTTTTHRGLRSAVLLLAAVSTALGTASEVCALPYTFTQIAEIGPQSGGENKGPAINNNGTVAFNLSEEGVFAGNGGPLTTIGLRADFPGVKRFRKPTINDNGTVAFWTDGTADGSEPGLFSGRGSGITTLVPPGSLRTFDFVATAQPGTSSDVFAFMSGAIGHSLYSSTNGAAPELLYSGAGGLGPPKANSGGSLAFYQFGPHDSLDASIYRRDPSGALTTIATAGAGFQYLGTVVSMNDAGMVLFDACSDFGCGDLWRGDGGAITHVASAPPGQEIRSEHIAINDDGTVVFLSTLFGLGRAIYTGPDSLADELIAVGDEFEGGIVTALDFWRDGLNDQGQIAFYVVTEDPGGGTHYSIVRADPVAAVPAPGSLILLAGALVAFGAACKRDEVSTGGTSG